MYELLERIRHGARGVLDSMASAWYGPLPVVHRLVAEPYHIETVEQIPEAPDLLRISGWALPDSDFVGKQAERFLANGCKPLEVEYPLLRLDIKEIFKHRINSEQSGFSMVVPADYPNGVLEITCLNSATHPYAKGREIWYLPDPELHTNLPDPDRRYRVIGNRDPGGFLRLGATDAFRIKAAYENVTGRDWAALEAVLDWGVGCGRAARHLAPELGGRFSGCDIDADNVNWCAANLPGNYRHSKLEPPLPYDDNSFDVIFGISVFTHLRAQWESRWLSELYRVLRPDGVMLMTIHGQTAMDFASLSPRHFQGLKNRIEREGVVVTGTNNQLDGFVDHPEEYVNVFHSRAHIQDVWDRNIQVLAHIPGYIFTHDLVVAMKTGAVYP